jgi:hypothetical protein
MAGYIALIIKYWPAVVALLFLLYTLASAAETHDTSHIMAALNAFLAAAGINHIAVSAHDKVDSLQP